MMEVSSYPKTALHIQSIGSQGVLMGAKRRSLKKRSMKKKATAKRAKVVVVGSKPVTDFRYPLGAFKLPKAPYSPEQHAIAIDEIEVTPKNLRAAVNGLTEAQLDTPYRPDGWTVRQVVHHLPDSHTQAYVRFKLALTEDVPTVGTYKEARWAEQADSAADVDVSLRMLESLHERWVYLLRRLDTAQWARRFNHPEYGEMGLDDLLAIYEWHGRHHIAHVTELRKREGWE